jgi:hypothetical protein
VPQRQASTREPGPEPGQPQQAPERWERPLRAERGSARGRPWGPEPVPARAPVRDRDGSTTGTPDGSSTLHRGERPTSKPASTRVQPMPRVRRRRVPRAACARRGVQCSRTVPSRTRPIP